jgi:hypothetical protein
MRKRGIWILGALCGPTEGPRKLGNSESGICRGVSWSLHTSKHGIWILGSLCRPTEGPRKLGNSESGIWVSVLQGCPPPLPPLALWVTAHPSPPWSTVGQPLFVHGLIMIVHVPRYGHFGITRNLEKFCVRVQDAIGTEIRSTKNDHLRHYFPIVPSLTIAYVDSQRTQRYTRHRRMTTVSSDRSLK